MTNLKILCKNRNGKTRDRLQPDAELMIDIILHESHVIVMQEHLYKLVNAARSAKGAQIAGYHMVMHETAQKN